MLFPLRVAHFKEGFTPSRTNTCSKVAAILIHIARAIMPNLDYHDTINNVLKLYHNTIMIEDLICVTILWPSPNIFD